MLVHHSAKSRNPGGVAHEGVAGVPSEEPGNCCAFGEVERVVDSDEFGGGDCCGHGGLPVDPNPFESGIKASTRSTPARDGPKWRAADTESACDRPGRNAGATCVKTICTRRANAGTSAREVAKINGARPKFDRLRAQ